MGDRRLYVYECENCNRIVLSKWQPVLSTQCHVCGWGSVRAVGWIPVQPLNDVQEDQSLPEPEAE